MDGPQTLKLPVKNDVQLPRRRNQAVSMLLQQRKLQKRDENISGGTIYHNQESKESINFLESESKDFYENFDSWKRFLIYLCIHIFAFFT